MLPSSSTQVTAGRGSFGLTKVHPPHPHLPAAPSLPVFVSSGYSVFSIGVADVDFVELQQIGSKPSERHVFVVDDFDAFDTIKENLITFICETASSSKLPSHL